MTTRSKSGIHRPKTPYVGTAEHAVGSLKNFDVSEPNSVDEALKVPHWKEAMEKEFGALRGFNRTSE